MSNLYLDKVKDAVNTVWKERPAWPSKPGETLDQWEERRKQAVAERLHELLFKCDNCNGELSQACFACVGPDAV